MDIHELIGDQVAALVEFYDNSIASDQANRLTQEVKELMGPDPRRPSGLLPIAK